MIFSYIYNILLFGFVGICVNFYLVINLYLYIIYKIRIYKIYKNVIYNSYYIFFNVGRCSKRIDVDNDERIMNIFDRNGVVFIFVGVVYNGIKCLVKLLLKYYCRGSFVEKGYI